MRPRPLNTAYKTARKIVIAVIGGTVVLVGVIMLVTPGPAFVAIPAGLAILAIEFAWARRWLKQIRARTESAFRRNRSADAKDSES
jgi:tellurite resistance protein TerC